MLFSTTIFFTLYYFDYLCVSVPLITEQLNFVRKLFKCRGVFNYVCSLLLFKWLCDYGF